MSVSALWNARDVAGGTVAAVFSIEVADRVFFFLPSFFVVVGILNHCISFDSAVHDLLLVQRYKLHTSCTLKARLVRLLCSYLVFSEGVELLAVMHVALHSKCL